MPNKRSSQKMLGVLLPRSYIAAIDRVRSESRHLKASRSAYIRKVMFDTLTAAGQVLDGRYINLGYIHGQEDEIAQGAVATGDTMESSTILEPAD